MDNIPNNEICSDIKKERKNENNICVNKTDDNAGKDKQKSNTIITHKIDFNLNSKYDNALLEELFISKEKSWRNDIINSYPEKENSQKNPKKFSSNQNVYFDDKQNLDSNKKEEMNNINIQDLNNIHNSIKEIHNTRENNNNERFKDFDEILFLEDNKDKKRKNNSSQKIISMEKNIEIPQPVKKRGSLDLNEGAIKDDYKKNLDIIEEVMEKEERNRNEFINENIINRNNELLKIKKEREIEGNHILIDIVNDNNEKAQNNNFRNNNIDFNYLNQNTNSTNENNIINKNNSINLEYSEDRKTEEEKEEHGIDNIINDKKNNIIIIDEKNIINNNIFTTPRTKENKIGDNTIKKNESIHYIDLENISKTNNYSINKNNIPNNNKNSLLNFTKKISFQLNNLMNTIDVTKPKEKIKKTFIKKENIDLNRKNKSPYNNNVINHGGSNNYIKNISSSNSQKNLFFYLLKEDKKIIKPKNNPISSLLCNCSYSNRNKNQINTLNEFYPIKILKREINNNKTSHNIMKNIKINRIKNTLNNINININKLKDELSYKNNFSENKILDEENNSLFQKNFIDEESIFHKTKRLKSNDLKNEKKYTHSEKTKIRTNSIFPLYNNFFNANQSDELLLNNHDDICKKKKEITHQNNYFNDYSTKKMKKNNINFKDFKNDDFFTNYKKNSFNKNIIGTYRNFNYNNNKNINKLNNYSFLSSYNQLNSYRNNSSYLMKNTHKNRTISNYSNNRKNNFHNYNNNYGNKVFYGINNLKYIGYKNVKTSVFPVNPFNNIYFSSFNN